MVFSFALCASFAFAQSNGASVSKTRADMPSMDRKAGAEINSSSAGYTGSIFTKDGNTYFTCTFSNSDRTSSVYTTGKVGANEQVDGTNIPVHTNAGDYGEWQRIPDSAYMRGNAFATTYPATASRFLNLLCNYFTPETRDDGFMLMSMIDNYGAWGGDNDPGIFDAWIKFQPVDLSTCQLGMVTFYQLYRAFNRDHTYVDYSTNNGTTWSRIEFNVKGVDINSNSSTRGTKRITLPRFLAGNSAVVFRIRYVDESDDGNGGYFLLVDDFKVVDAPENHLRFTSCQYFEGFYQMMPQGLEVPVVWASDFNNDGNLAQTNARGMVYEINQAGVTSEVARQTLGTVAAISDSNRAFVIDPLGIYDSVNTYHGFSYFPDSNWSTGPYNNLSTAVTGDHHFFSDIYTDYYNNHVYDTLGTFDTLIYNVNWGTITDAAGHTHPAGTWARDHGVLTYNGDGTDGAGNYYTPGLVAQLNAWTDDFHNTGWNKAGYGTLVSYVTGNTIPNDWRILGVEIVPATVPGMQTVGATLIPYLWIDSFPDPSHVSWHFPAGGLGVDYYTVKADDVNSNFTSGYKTIEQGYNTVKILFPTQPRLDPTTIYHIGFRLAEDANFAVAETRTNFMQGSESVSFANEPGMEDYKNILGKDLGNGNIYSVITWDSRTSSSDDNGISWYRTTNYPMIRMIVGPSYEVSTYNVSFECDDPNMGYFINDNNESLCDETVEVYEGYPITFYIQPVPGYVIDKVTINGVESGDYQIQTDPDGNEYGVMEIASVTENMTVKCFFKQNNAIDPVASRVSMKLQPNPASSNVYVSLKGVTGNVNMSLLDMSGRVVTTSQFNAENGANINVSNLAKGAYFVRITNNNFTKIEKLIVR